MSTATATATRAVLSLPFLAYCWYWSLSLSVAEALDATAPSDGGSGMMPSTTELLEHLGHVQFCQHSLNDEVEGILKGNNGLSTVFCAHGGTCRSDFMQNIEHPCDCPDGFQGPHCEYDASANPMPDCVLTCYNQGLCQVSAQSYQGVLDEDKPFESIQYCLCPHGYGGLQCEHEEKSCDGHHCYYGGTCRETDSGDEFCDCTEAKNIPNKLNGDDVLQFGGRYCQDKATSFCSRLSDHNGQQFCTNGGSCRIESHLGCNCLEGFVGPICEFEDKDLGSSSHLDCNLPCENGGLCRKGAKDLSYLEQFGIEKLLAPNNAKAVASFHTSFSDSGEHCVCPHGYVGLQCEYHVDVCPGAEHVCMHGSSCVPGQQQEDGTNAGTISFTCDCSDADPSTRHRFAGKYCEYQATDYCTEDGDIVPKSSDLFCTNNGVCLDHMVLGEEHPGCLCPDGYEGSHCEFLKAELFDGSKKNNASPADSPSSHSSMPTTVAALLVIASSMLVIILSCLFIYYRRQQSYEDSASTSSSVYKDQVSPLKRIIATANNTRDALGKRFSQNNNRKRVGGGAAGPPPPNLSAIHAIQNSFDAEEDDASLSSASPFPPAATCRRVGGTVGKLEFDPSTGSVSLMKRRGLADSSIESSFLDDDDDDDVFNDDASSDIMCV